MNHQAEQARILAEYARRTREIPADYYSLLRPVNLFRRHGVERALARGLTQAGLVSLDECRALEIGCGSGQWLSTLEEFGVRRENLAGIELDPTRQARCAARFAGADVRRGDARQLPWPDAHFSVVLQATVFTSILDPDLRRAVAREMLRVLQPGGCILWYDFLYNNPGNPHVRGVGRREIAGLFPGCRLRLRRITLAPPLAARLVPICWSAARLLEKLRLLNTHYFGLVQPLPPRG